MPRFRSVPSAVHDSPEWLTTTALARMAHRCLRPSAGRLELLPAREGEPTWKAFQRKAAECGAYFDDEESAEIVAGAVTSDLWQAPEGGGLVIAAFPPSYEREREHRATGEGSRGGKSAAERMAKHRAAVTARRAAAEESERARSEALRGAAEREALERLDAITRAPSAGLAEPSSGAPDDASRSAASDTSQGSQLPLLATPQGRAGVDVPVTGSQPVTGRRPEAPRPTPPGPPKGGRGGEGTGAVAAKVLEIGERSADELGAIESAQLGALTVRILSRGRAVFASEATADELRALGDAVKGWRYPELELRAIGAWFEHSPDDARAIFTHDEGVRRGGRITVTLLAGKRGAAGAPSGKGLRRAREVAVPWASQKGLFDRRRPGPVAARADEHTATAEAR